MSERTKGTGTGSGTGTGAVPGVLVRPYRDPVGPGPLFRDEAPAAALPVPPADPDTVERPSVPAAAWTGPVHPRAPRGAVPAPARAPDPARTPGPARAPASEAQRRTLPPAVDRELAERPARVCSGWWALLATAAAGTGAGLLVVRYGVPRPSLPVDARPVAALAGCLLLALLALVGLRRGRAGHATVLTLFGRYRGTVRRTGLTWAAPFLRRVRIDVRLRHWRSEPLSVVDAEGTALHAVVLVVWRVKDTARALLSVDDHAGYLREQVESATARVLSRVPADSFDETGRETLRDTEAVGEALTRLLAAECRAVGIEVFSARPVRIEYAPEVARAMQRRRIAAIDARHRDSVLTSVIDAVDDTVDRMSDRGLVSLDDYERKALVKDLTVAFYTARGTAADAR
ncbi:SPFH domain-containing protein [Streptomyces sp. NPDC059104]|uniref:SPFH domain-containing protein n=1 Tax=Streptomyces sp. NPDC059104 TaxID=3346729 RepID=UPI0036AA3D7E